MITYKDEFLMHYGITGQKKGRRRFQNPDGSLTAAGRLRYLDPSYGRSSGSFIKVQEGANRPKDIIGFTSGVKTSGSIVGASKSVKNASTAAVNTAVTSHLGRSTAVGAVKGATNAAVIAKDAKNGYLRTNSIWPSIGEPGAKMAFASKPAHGSSIKGDAHVQVYSDSKNTYERYYNPDGSIEERVHSKDGKTTQIRKWAKDGEIVEDGTLLKDGLHGRSPLLTANDAVRGSVSAAVNTASKIAQQQANDKIKTASDIYKKTLSSVGVRDSKKKVSEVVTKQRIDKATKAVKNVMSKAVGPFLSKKKKTVKKTGGGRKDEIK